MICLSVNATNFDECVSLLRKHSFIEFRLDKTEFTLDQIKRLFSMPNKMIAACRPVKWDDNKRTDILTTAIKAGANYVDIELESSDDFLNKIEIAMKGTLCKLILSYHNHDNTPEFEELKDIINSCFDKGASIAKVSCKSNSEEDNARLLSLYIEYETGQLISIGMNQKGRITRIAAPYLGAPFTYASTDSSFETAPGQIDYRNLKNIYDLMK
ncbi:type I 3-dehydroquinate dehydratase [Bacteroidota bacterium]